MKHFPLFSLLSVLVLSLSSCASSPATGVTDTPAIRINVNNKAQNELNNIVAKSLHQKEINLLRSSLTKSNTLFIEREILFGMDLTKPLIFKLFINAKPTNHTKQQCFLVNMQTQQRYLLSQTQCVSYKK